MEYITVLGSIAIVHLLAISSPGPTFVVVSSFALGGDRRAGLFVTLGVCFATLTWASLAAAGLGAALSASGWLYPLMQIAGGVYLAWMGFKMLRTTWRNEPQKAPDLAGRRASPWQAMKAGYLTNISNPKVIAYYASLFGVMIPASAPTGLFLGAVMTALAVSTMWWLTVTMFFSLPRVRQGYLRIRRGLDALMGALLVGLGAKLIMSR